MLVIPKILYLIGSAVCLQRISHSFFYGDQQMPLGSRWTGMALGALFVLIVWIIWFRKKRNGAPSKFVMIASIISIIYFAFDSISSVFNMTYVNNYTRLFSGLFFGMSINIYLTMILSQSFWRNTENRNPVVSNGSFILLFVINILIFLSLYFGNQFLIYILSYLSILGLILLVFIINAIIIILIAGKFTKYFLSKKILKMFLMATVLTFISLFTLISARLIVFKYYL